MTENVLERSVYPIHWMHRYIARFMITSAIVLIVVYALQPDWLVPVTMVPPWAWLVPVLIAVGLVRHQSAWILAVWLIFAVIHVEQFRSLPRSLISVEHEKTNSIRVVSINCNIGNINAALESLAEEPDVVLLQESPSFDNLKVYGFQDPVAPVDVVWAGDNSVAVFGSIEPVQAEKASHFCHVVATMSDSLKVDVVSLRLSAPVFRVDFWSPGFWRDHYDKRIDHKRQLNEVIEHLRQNQQTEYLIVGGDFNSVTGDGALATTLTDLEDSFLRGGRGWGATGTNDCPLFRVDQIWSSSNLRSLSSRSVTTQNSDHRMVVADFEVIR